MNSPNPTDPSGGHAAPDGAMAPATTAARGRGRRDLLLVGIGLVVGLVLVMVVRGLISDGDAPVGATSTATDGTNTEEQDGGDTNGGGGEDGGDADGSDVTVAAGDGIDSDPVAPDEATQPVEALGGFLAAEAERDFDRSWEYLTASDQEQFGDAARWAAAHRQLLPVRGFRILDDTLATDGDRTSVEVLVASDGVLDPVVGLVPAVSRSTWPLEQVGDVWRVGFAATSFEVVLPDDGAAVGATQAWVDAAVACDEPPTGVTRLLGAPDLVAELCDAGGDVVVGEAGLLPPAGDAFGLVAAFGPESLGWARVVPVDEPLAIDVALAPLSDGWQVVGVLQR